MNKDLNQVLDDLGQVKGFIGQLQGTIQQIVKKSPSLDEFNELIQLINLTDVSNVNSFQIGKVKHLLNTNQMKLCIKLRQLYEQDELPFLKMLSLLNLKNKDEDNYQIINFIMEYHRDPLDLTSDYRVLEELMDDRLYEVDWSRSSSELASLLPDLLPIKDDKLHKKVFLDKSFIDPMLEIANFEQYNQLFNNRLILRGDAFLRMILHEIVDYKFPHLYYEDVKLIVEKLVDENVLFKLSIIYQLLDNFKYKLSNTISTGDKITVIGNIFLSYVGGLSIEYTLGQLKIWIFKIYKIILPTVDGLDLKFKSLEDIASRQFNFLFDSSEYSFEELETEPFVIKLNIKGQSVIGTNSQSFELAKNKAIYEFMNSNNLKPALLAQYGKQFETNEIEIGKKQFKSILESKNIQVDYDIRSTGEFHYVMTTWNSVVLGVGVDRNKDIAIGKCELDSYKNLSVLLAGN